MGAIISLVLGGAGRLLGKVFKWFSDNPAAALTLVMGIAFAMVIVGKNSQITDLRKVSAEKDSRITNLQNGLFVARANVRTMNATLIKQNGSIEDLAKQGSDSSVKFGELMAAMSTQNAVDAKELKAIDAAKPTSDKCTSALALIKGAVK